MGRTEIAYTLPHQVGIALPIQEELTGPDLVQLAVLAEDEGFDAVFAGEIAGPEVFSLLGAVAASTNRVNLATGVVSVFTRSAALTAMAFVTLESLAPGRVIAGIGVGSHVVVDTWHGRNFVDTARTLREFVEAFRTAAAGERTTYPGVRVRTSGFRVTLPLPGSIPVFIGAMTHNGLRLAGAVSDGVLLAFCPSEEVAERIAFVREGAERADRDPDAVTIAVYVNAYAGPEIGVATERMRRLILQYAVQPTHQPSFLGAFPQAPAAAKAWDAGDRTAALDLVSTDVVHRLTAVGSSAVVADRLDQLRSAGVTLPVLFPQSLRFGDAISPAETISRVGAELRRRR